MAAAGLARRSRYLLATAGEERSVVDRCQDAGLGCMHSLLPLVACLNVGQLIDLAEGGIARGDDVLLGEVAAVGRADGDIDPARLALP